MDIFKKDKLVAILIMYNAEKKRIIPIPMHSKELKRGLVRGITMEAESSEQEFLKLK